MADAEPRPSQPDSSVSHVVPDGDRQFRQRVTTGVGIAVIMVALTGLVILTIRPLLMIFLAILFTLALRGVSKAVQRRTKLTEKQALLAVIGGLIAVTVISGVLLGGQIIAQIEQLAEELPVSIAALQGQLQESGWGQALLSALPTSDDLVLLLRSSFSQATGAFSNAFGWATNALIVIFLTIAFAFEPDVYVDNLLRLVPQSRRARIRDVIDSVATILQKWLLARFLSMVFVGVLTTIGLFIGGAPLALTMGLIAGITSFIPTFGPIIAVVPAALLALLHGPGTAIYVVVLYIGVQQIDNFLLTPILDRTTVSLPAALTIISQLLLGVVAGFMGLTLAAPIAATVIVIVKMLYVEDMLKDYGDPLPGQVSDTLAPQEQ